VLREIPPVPRSCYWHDSRHCHRLGVKLVQSTGLAAADQLVNEVIQRHQPLLQVACTIHVRVHVVPPDLHWYGPRATNLSKMPEGIRLVYPLKPLA
jgi:hypothetical protein